MAEQLSIKSLRRFDGNEGSLLSENVTIHGKIHFHNSQDVIHAVLNKDIDTLSDSILQMAKHAMIKREKPCNQVSIASSAEI